MKGSLRRIPAMAGIAPDAPLWIILWVYLLDLLRLFFPWLPIPIP